MKVLFDHPFPFFLAHGGAQLQIEQTKNALEVAGLGVEYVRWWDSAQEGQIIHYFGRPSASYIEFAHQKQKKVILSELLGGLGGRGAVARAAQQAIIRGTRLILPAEFCARMAWDAYERADACVALTSWEAQLMRQMFSAPPEKVHVVPNGVEPVFLESAQTQRGDWLVCAATITEVKRVLELAEAAVLARVPVWFVGRPFDEGLNYPGRFLRFARRHTSWVRYEGSVEDRAAMARVYREARGFVLLSRWETLSLAALEAAACGCPLLLSDLPWAHSVFGDQAAYCPVTTPRRTATALRKFYLQAPQRPIPRRPKSWSEVAKQLVAIYELVLRNS